jgi:hypothetical protein
MVTLVALENENKLRIKCQMRYLPLPSLVQVGPVEYVAQSQTHQSTFPMGVHYKKINFKVLHSAKISIIVENVCFLFFLGKFSRFFD